MTAAQLSTLLRTRLGVRVGPHTTVYVAARLAARGDKPIPIMATDARTGVPLRQTLRGHDVRDDAQGRLF